MNVLALLTGRGGSILKNKNILPLLNKPVLAYSCIEAKKIKQIKNYFVSSDDQKILNAANKYGFKIIKRPKKFAKDNSLHRDVILHSIKELKNRNINPDILIVLLANAPIVKAKWIKDCINLISKKKATAVVPVIQDNDKHPLRAKKKVGNFLKPFVNTKKRISTNRQDLEESYFLCHNFWVIKTKEIIKNNGYPPWKFMGKKVIPYLVKHSHDIHVKEDIILCKSILKEKI